MKEVIIKVIPHSEQRYETCGDWWFDSEGVLQIRVSDMSDSRYEQLIAFHEYAEAMLCNYSGVSEREVLDFDIEFEKMRAAFPKLVGNKEPGNSRAAPYNKQHKMATRLEHQLAEKLNVDWEKYGEVVNNLSK